MAALQLLLVFVLLWLPLEAAVQRKRRRQGWRRP